MTVTTHTFEISARAATQLLASSGLSGVTVNLPTNLLALTKLVNRTLEGTRAMQVTANLNEGAADLKQWMTDMGMDVVALRVPDAMNTAAAATAAANAAATVDGNLGRIGSRARGLYIGRVKTQLDALLVHADARHAAAAGWASEGFWQLVRFEPSRVANLVRSIEAGRLDDVLEALIEYVAARKRAAGRAAIDAQPLPSLAAMEAAKDEASADAEHYGY
jgi:ribosomal protein L12E/L44/L45/RPP1/RPP2